MMKCGVPLGAMIGLLMIATCSADSHSMLECPDGWTLGWSKCYRVFYGENRRAYARAREVCESYGSRLVTIKDQLENDLIGATVEGLAGAGESYYIGLSKEATDGCSTCPDLKWSNGEYVSEHEGFWSDDQPDDMDGDCVYAMKNDEDYVYDRPYTWAYSNCYIQRSFVCERMAAPEDSFHCMNGGYTHRNNICNGNSDCEDGSDEFNCSSSCRYYHTLPSGDSGPLGQLQYRDATTCTWAIETPPGTNAYVQFNNFNTEYQADYVTVYIGSVSETKATRVDRISGNIGTKIYQSYNNMMFIKFTSDSSVTSSGFTGIYGAFRVDGNQMSLTADNVLRTYDVSTFDVANTETFLGQRDYVIVIKTKDQYQFGPMITLVIESLQINDGDSVMFFDGDSPREPLLASNCNDDDVCTNYNVVYSTGKALSILLRTAKTVTNNVDFRFRYRQGCYYETTDPWGTIFTPGFPGKIHYPNYVKCTWKINVNEPVAIYFDPASSLKDAAFNRKANGDFLKMYDNGTMVDGSVADGLTTSDIAGKVFTPNTGKITLEFDTSSTRSARGFLATWSTACPNPNYDDGVTIVSTSEPVFFYTSKMDVSCVNGYAFQQQQTQLDDVPTFRTSVTVECGFKGIWKDFLQIPKCTRKYCGPVPSIPNAIIESATSVVYEGKAKYKCDAGSVSSTGSLEITCRADGTWSPRPTCIAATCPSGVIVTNIANGNGTLKNGDGTSIGTVYEYNCNPGFEFDGEPYVFCKEDGTWTQNRAPSCRRLTCRLPEIENGVYRNGITAGQFINFESSASVFCNTGYELADNSPTTVTCQADRGVTTLPQCEDRNECDTPGICQGECHNTEGSFYCTCGTGYTLGFDLSTCVDINECTANTHNCDGLCNNLIGSYRCTCSPPYVLYTEDMTSGYAIPTTAGERGDLPTDTYHINHTCVLISCDAPPDTINNGQLLTQRSTHRYGDYVEYQCDIGYSPRRSVLNCDRNGNWVGTVPTCTPATCTDTVGSVQNRPVFAPGPYSYGEELILQCTVADQQFNRSRFCTYNKELDDYEMQGSSYECGVIDCGTPKQEPGSTYGSISDTLYGSSFEFTCFNGSRQGATSEGSPSTVKCLAAGYWDFGSLQCTGNSCPDPGYPAGGDIIATSFADKSSVRFECDRPGYTLSRDVTLTCQGNNFFSNGETVPTCIDTENPVITGCPDTPIIVKKYEHLKPRLPQLTATDNTGISSFTISPRNANSTLYVSTNLQVTYTVTDFAGNIDRCFVNVQLADETPPEITCPDVRYIELETESDSVPYNKLEANDFATAASFKTFKIDSEPTTLTVNDLYHTFTYTVSVTDQSDNPTSCRGQVFVKPKLCSDLDYPTPLNADKVCTTLQTGGRECVLTCQAAYTFEDSKSKTARCTNGIWNIEKIPACVPDEKAPEVSCPPSRQIDNLSTRNDQHEVDFTLLSGNVVSNDLNTRGAPAFRPERYTFTASDLYRPKVVQVSVTDSAGNTGYCSFQYTAIPPVCSELTLLVPQFGSVVCTRRDGPFVGGYDCTITCNTGRILRHYGASKTVSCSDGVGWNDEDIYPTCIPDTVSPVITCPTSRSEKLYTGNEVRTVVFATDASYTHTETDYSGIKSVTFNPPSYTLSTAVLNLERIIQMTVTDNADNTATCSFTVSVEADVCSPLGFPTPVNGQKDCSQTVNGYSCNVTCNFGYSFYGTTDSYIISTCANGGSFSQYIPDCVNNADIADKQYVATLEYEYVPNDDNILTVPDSCTDYYISRVSERQNVGENSVLENMARKFWDNCQLNYGPFASGELSVSFFPQVTSGSILADGIRLRRVRMVYQYTVFAPDPTIDSKCSALFNSTIKAVQNSLPLSQNIPGNATCPELKWNSFANIPFEEENCVPQYFQSLTDTNRCSKCPAGTESNGIRCSICPKGSYRTYDGTQCVQCQDGFTTRYVGATSSTQCVSLCTGGRVSDTGHSPCYSCPVGSYKVSNTQCQSCGAGKTTTGVGKTSADDCVDEISINNEPCTIGTQDTGNRVCELCSVGTYRSANTATCVECPNQQTSTYFKGAISSSQCFGKCSAGFTSSTGLAPCLPCPKGQYSVNVTTCETCPTGFTTVTEGLDTCVAFSSLRLKCPRGTSRNADTGQCEKCPLGTYNQVEEGTCLPCSSTTFTYNTGTTTQTMCQTKCPPGFYSSTGLSPCTPCGFGSYSSVFGANACTPCSLTESMITATTTSTSSNDCIAQCSEGSFSYNGYNLNAACRQCPLNHYQNQKGATSCSQCPPFSTFSTSPGLTDIAQCSATTNLCDQKCQNNQNCIIQDNEAVCQCSQGLYYGLNCAIAVNHCLSQPCYNNGACSSTSSGYTCDCTGTGATGTRCETITKLCDVSQASATCQNGGHCINRPGKTECLCPEGYTGNTCSQLSKICDSLPCDQDGARRCIDVSNDKDLRRYCECNPGYTGETCSEDIDECASSPCINGGTCRNLQNRFQCDCLPGYGGIYCQIRQASCVFVNCRQNDPSAYCVDGYTDDRHGCICSPGHTFDGAGYIQYQITLNKAVENLETYPGIPLQTATECREICDTRGTQCSSFTFDSENNECYIFPTVIANMISRTNANTYTKSISYPTDDFYTMRYSLNTPLLSRTDSELLSTLRDVYGLNICGGTEPLAARCCPVGETCLDNSNLPFRAQCSATTGLTISNTDTDYSVQFKCAVHRVFKENNCRIKTDYCGIDTCKNGGTCRAIFGGYICSCLTGYTGKNCQTNIDECAGNPCNNGGTCEDQVGFYTCKCTDKYEGPTCNSPKNFCQNNNCNGHGTCSNIAGVGYECSCFLGYEGDDCELEIDFCRSNPCQHGGACNKRLGGYTCDCVDGWHGVNCESPVEHCSQLTSGRLCQATCYNIFNSYYCRCEENTFGVNCENKPNPCRDYNKCQNSATCSYNGSMSCSCPMKYTGDGCQILRDYCGKDNPCENDGTCSVTNDGYQCTCKPGYDGMRCENEINECAGITCPGSGQCYDAVNNYYCRCPIKYTGTDCTKVFDRNYDMYFNHPQGNGFAWIPYFIQVNAADFISLSVWVRYSQNDGTGVYLTQFVGDKLEEAERFMELNEQGVRFYIQDGSNPYMQLTYDNQAKVNDGNWHLMTVLYDMVNGEVRHYLDTIWHGTRSSQDLVMPAADFRMWVVLGCEFDNMEHRCQEGGRGFNGYLSQVNWYKRELTFEGDPNSQNVDRREGEIPKNFRLPQYIFDSNINDLILVWNEYQFESGVSRITPSEAQPALCSDITRNPPCSSYRSATLPSVTDCPDDMVITSKDRIVTVTWTEPKFLNLGATGQVMKPSRLPGSTFTWGVYRNTYIGMDGNGNKAFCHFTVHVTAGECDNPENPYGGQQECTIDSDRKGCKILCNDNNHVIDRSHPYLFTCGPSGWWNADKPFQRFRYPSCGLVLSVPNVRIYIRVLFSIGTSACLAAENSVRINTLKEIVKLREKFDDPVKNRRLCQVDNCSDVTIDIECGSISKRRRRQTPSDSRMLLEITLPSVTARTELDGEEISAEEFFTYFILGDEILVFESVPNLIFLSDNFFIQTTEICPEGQILRNGQCVECGPGNYFRYTDSSNTTAICDDCPRGYYQELSGTLSCTQCANGFTTEMTGEYSSGSCKKSCPVGEYFNKDIQDCAKCEVGYYQDEVGSFMCKGCPAGYTTKDEGAVSASLCSVSCDSGYELNNDGECDPCSIGQYRNATETRTCVSCRAGYITLYIASKSSDDCNIVACNAGNYRDVDTNTCKPCPLNTYQPNMWNTSCISCGDPTRWRTESVGSELQTQCKYYCPSGYEVKQDPNYRCEICPIGTYKDNSLDIQGSCLTCPGNKRTEMEGSTSSTDCTIYKCPKGYKPNALNNGCVVCPIGYYQDVEYSKDCKQCQDGYSTRQTASTESGQCERYCPSGEEKINGVCKPCKKGFYKDNNNGLFEPCVACNPLYTTADTGADSSADCSIRTCPPGTKRNADDTGCEDCPLGTYQPKAYEKDCIRCGNGTSTRTTKSTEPSACETYCDSGYEKTSTGCIGCEIGYYKDNENDGYFSPCNLCPIEFITAQENSVSSAMCIVGNCSAGQYLKPDNTCGLCEIGFYQPTKWEDGCIQCGIDKTTENVGSDELTDCILECRPGYEDVMGSCQECKRGYYKIEYAAASCKECPTGFTTESTGANSTDLCSLPACTAGEYLDRVTDPANPQCQPCDYDTYQDEIWQEQCDPCLDSRVTLETGSDEESDCVLDCGSGLEYNHATGECEFCSVGYYRNKNDRLQTQCQLCPIDKITSGEGATDISDCSVANCTEPGYYRNPVTNECTQCPIGTYNSMKWNTSCTDCPLGNSTRTTGASSIDECISICPLGQFVGEDNSCELCPPETYRSDMSTDTCTPCPNGLRSPGPGADSESDCTLSPCDPGERYVLNNRNCVKCEIGTYQPNSGSFQCIDCPFSIKYTKQEGAVSVDDCRSPCSAGEQFDAGSSSCVACPSGYYQPSAFEFQCLECPEGRRFTENLGARRIEDCLSYCSVADANDCSGNATCSVSSTDSLGYTCACFPNYESRGAQTGRVCIHKCDLGFCKNGGSCSREGTTSCTCSQWYTGDRCQSRVKAEDLSDNTLDIVIPVSIAAGGLILFLIMLAVCCLCWRRSHPVHSPEPQYSEFHGNGIEKGSVISHAYGGPYGSRPPSRLMMLAPAQEMYYDNQIFTKDNAAVYEA